MQWTESLPVTLEHRRHEGGDPDEKFKESWDQVTRGLVGCGKALGCIGVAGGIHCEFLSREVI